MKIKQSKFEQIIFEEVMAMLNEQSSGTIGSKIEKIFDVHVRNNPKLKKEFMALAAETGTKPSPASAPTTFVGAMDVVDETMAKLQSLSPALLNIGDLKQKLGASLAVTIDQAATVIRGKVLMPAGLRGYVPASYSNVWNHHNVLGNHYMQEDHRAAVLAIGSRQLSRLKGWRKKLLDTMLPSIKPRPAEAGRPASSGLTWDVACVMLCYKLASYTWRELIGANERHPRENELSVMMTRTLIGNIEVVVQDGITNTGLGDVLKLTTYLKMGHGKADLIDAMKYVKDMPDFPTHENINQITAKLARVAKRAPKGTAYRKTLVKLAIIFGAVGSSR